MNIYHLGAFFKIWTNDAVLAICAVLIFVVGKFAFGITSSIKNLKTTKLDKSAFEKYKTHAEKHEAEIKELIKDCNKACLASFHELFTVHSNSLQQQINNMSSLVNELKNAK